MRKSNEIFLIETLKIITECTGEVMPRYSVRFDNFSNYMYTRSLMSDESSQEVYDNVLRLLLAHDFLPRDKALSIFPVHSDEFWRKVDNAAFEFPIEKLDSYKTHTYRENLIFTETFKLHGYSYEDICCVKAGDIVIDCGAYIGDVSLYFRDKMDNQGKVYAFEPLPSSFEKLQNNIGIFSAEDVIVPVNNATGSVEGKLKFRGIGASSKFHNDGDFEVNVTTIDKFAENKELSSVDFIKMDIEGAELDSLMGAKNVIKKYRPRMAICIYHKMEDHWQIPKFILSLDSSYKFYVRHNSRATHETVLFCVPSNTQTAQSDKAENSEVFVAMGELYKSVHAQLSRKSHKLALDKILTQLEGKLGKLNSNWTEAPNHYDRIRMYVTNFGNNYIDITRWTDGYYVELKFHDIKRYDADIQEKIKDIIACVKAKYPDFILQSGGGYFLLPYKYDTDQSTEVVAAVIRLMNIAFDELRKIGLLKAVIEEMIENHQTPNGICH